MTRPSRSMAIIASIVIVAVVGAIVGWRVLIDRTNASIPHADLFGSDSPSATGMSPTPSPTPPPGSDIRGPLNILLVGVDTRVSVPGWTPHSDAVMIMHVSADLSQAYLTSLPRDLVVNVPAFGPAKFGGERTKLTHAMSYGSTVPGSNRPNPAQGFQLLAKTISAYTGINRFDAGAIVTFNGLSALIEAIGGIDIYVDQTTPSIHLRPDGHFRPACGSCDHGYSGPQMIYNVGNRHMFGWQALDYSRQRYLPGGDYTRQRHQRQIIKAAVNKILSRDIVENPLKITDITHRLGDTLIFDGRGRTPVEFGYALRHLTAASITLVGLPGSAVYGGGQQYLGESLGGVATGYFAALRQDTLAAFVKAHPDLVNAPPRS